MVRLRVGVRVRVRVIVRVRVRVKGYDTMIRVANNSGSNSSFRQALSCLAVILPCLPLSLPYGEMSLLEDACAFSVP